jgi:hypothetical protein
MEIDVFCGVENTFSYCDHIIDHLYVWYITVPISCIYSHITWL